MYLAKFDSSGNNLWAKSAGGGANEGTEAVNAIGLGTDANGNVYVVGSYTTTDAIFGNVTLASVFNGSSFLVKYDAQGNALWALNVGGNLNNANSIAVDANGNSFITGSFTGSYIIGGPDSVPLNSNIEGYTIKYDSAGNSVWATGISGNNVFNNAITLDAAGNVYVTGSYDGDSVLIGNSIVLSNNHGDGMFTVKYDKNGNPLWAKNVSLSSFVNPGGIATDGQGNVYVTGYTTADTLIFGIDTTITGSSTSNIFIAAYDSSGNSKWLHSTTNNNNITSSCISANASGQVFITGSFATPSVVIGNTTLVNNDTLGPEQAFFIAEYNSAGDVVWVTGGLSANNDMDAGASLQADNKGHLYVTGIYAGPSIIFANDTLLPFGTPPGPANVFVVKYEASETSVGIAAPETTINNITVYPNPSTGSFCFKGISNGSTIEIYNVLGQRLYSAIPTGDTYVMNIGAEAKGVYLYRVVASDNLVQQGKIVLQ
jgi:hypothetical protein